MKKVFLFFVLIILSGTIFGAISDDSDFAPREKEISGNFTHTFKYTKISTASNPVYKWTIADGLITYHLNGTMDIGLGADVNKTFVQTNSTMPEGSYSGYDGASDCLSINPQLSLVYHPKNSLMQTGLETKYLYGKYNKEDALGKTNKAWGGFSFKPFVEYDLLGIVAKLEIEYATASLPKGEYKSGLTTITMPKMEYSKLEFTPSLSTLLMEGVSGGLEIKYNTEEDKLGNTKYYTITNFKIKPYMEYTDLIPDMALGFELAYNTNSTKNELTDAKANSGTYSLAPYLNYEHGISDNLNIISKNTLTISKNTGKSAVKYKIELEAGINYMF